MKRFPLGLALLLLAGSALAGCLGAGGAGDGEDPDDDGDPQPSAPAGNVPVAWGDAASATLRPGASLGGYCTFNWLFSAPTGAAYIGTAAHCTELGERVALGGGDEVGSVVFDSDTSQGADTALDFSLIRLDETAVPEAHPQMLGFDGPTGVSATPAAGDLVALHGYGTVFGDQDETRGRMGALMAIDEKEYRANMPAVWGDSGAPILHVATGEALGIVSRFGIEPPLPTTDVGPRVTWILAELHRAGFRVELATA